MRGVTLACWPWCRQYSLSPQGGAPSPSLHRHSSLFSVWREQIETRRESRSFQPWKPGAVCSPERRRWAAPGSGWNTWKTEGEPSTMPADGASAWATYINCSAEQVCYWLEGPESEAWKKSGGTWWKRRPYLGYKEKQIRGGKVPPRPTKDFCRIRKFQKTNLDSLVALVKPQTSQILKVSAELDEWANFKKKKKKILGIYFSWINPVYPRAHRKCLKSGSDFQLCEWLDDHVCLPIRIHQDSYWCWGRKPKHL